MGMCVRERDRKDTQRDRQRHCICGGHMTTSAVHLFSLLEMGSLIHHAICQTKCSFSFQSLSLSYLSSMYRSAETAKRGLTQFWRI